MRELRMKKGLRLKGGYEIEVGERLKCVKSYCDYYGSEGIVYILLCCESGGNEFDIGCYGYIGERRMRVLCEGEVYSSDIFEEDIVNIFC